jgi:uncharacterized protein
LTASARPLPIPDEQSGPYWEAASNHILSIARCSRCGSFSHPPDVVCPHCHSADPGFVWTAVSGRGRIRSWTVMRQSFLPGFDASVPFVLVDVELDEQPELRLIGQLTDGPDAPLRIGSRVSVVFEALSPDISVPEFALDPRE